MKIDKVETTIRNRYDTIDRLFKKIAKSPDGEDIRKFRIEVKKLRALLDLLADKGSEENPICVPKSVDAFYGVIGVLRSFQLQDELVRKAFPDRYPILPVNYLAFLAARISAACQATSKSKKEKPKFRKVVALALKRRIDAGNRRALEFARVRIKIMNDLLHPFFQGDETLHAIRKVLKDVIHNWSYIKSTTLLKKGFSVFTDIEDMKIMAKLLGNFQNKCSALALLIQYDSKHEGNKRGRTFLRDLEKKWKDEKEILREEVSRIVHDKIVAHQQFEFLPALHHPNLAPLLLTDGLPAQ